MPEPTEIRTERLLLRPFRLTDADDVYAYAKEPEFSRYSAACRLHTSTNTLKLTLPHRFLPSGMFSQDSLSVLTEESSAASISG